MSKRTATTIAARMMAKPAAAPKPAKSAAKSAAKPATKPAKPATKSAKRSTRAGTADALLAAIDDAPDDDAPRAVYADHLIERGERDRGELIVRQLARGRRAPTAAEAAAELKLIKRLFAAILGRLVEPMGAKMRNVGPTRGYNHRFERGFLVATGLRGNLARIARAPQLRTVEHLNLGDAHVPTATAAAIVFDPAWRALRSLVAPHALAARLPGSSLAPQLRALRIDARDAGQATGAVAVARALPALARLDLDAGGDYRPDGNGRIVRPVPPATDLAAIASALAIAHLSRLDVTVTDAQLSLVRTGNRAWRLHVTTGTTAPPDHYANDPLAELIAALARLPGAPVKRILNANADQSSWQGGVEVDRTKTPLPPAVRRAFPDLRVEHDTLGDNLAITHPDALPEDDTYNEHEGRYS